MYKSFLILFALLCLCIGQGFAYQDIDRTAVVGGRIAPDGTEINLDLAGSQHLRNKVGTNRMGLCVYTSAEHSGRWQNIELLIGLRDYMTHYPGGSTPTMFDNVMKRIAKEKNVPVPDYLNLTGGRELMPILKKAIDNGLMPAVTYGRSPTGRYRGQHIDHMVTMVHYDKAGNIAILDNNYPGIDQYEWLNEEQFYRAFTDGASYGWCMIFLSSSGPPMLPFNE